MKTPTWRSTLRILVSALNLRIFTTLFAVELVPIGEWPGAPFCFASSVVVVGGRAFLAAEGLAILDVSEPSRPTILGHDLSIPVMDLALSPAGDRAFVTDGRGELQILDVSQPHAMVSIGRYETDGRAMGVEVVGTRAYVTTARGISGGSGSLEILDVSDPSQPKRLGAHNTQGRSHRLVVNETLAYVGEGLGSSGMEIFDISQPQDPIRLGSFDQGSQEIGGVGTVVDLDVRGHMAYLASTSGLHIVDVTNPARPIRIGGHDSSVLSVQVAGSLAFVAGNEGLQILDVGTPSDPKLIGSFDGQFS